jgi:PEGA domain
LSRLRSKQYARALFALFTCLGLIASSASAAEPSPVPVSQQADTPETSKAREEFLSGAELVKQARWGEAMGAFERSSKLRPHAITTYNIGACERAMGFYTRAQKTFQDALHQNEANGRTDLPAALIVDIEGYLSQIRSLLSAALVTLVPANAAISVDGRPLELTERASNPPVLAAGVRDPGPGETPPASVFRIELDPGLHVITLSRKGFADAVVNRTFLPGATAEMSLHLDRLPATLHVASYPSGGVVTVDGVDVGATPIDVSRPAGSYKVIVKKSGYVPYETELVIQSGEDVNLSPNLPKEKVALTQRWWFWTAVGVVVLAAAGGTYLVERSRETNPAPPPDGGGLGWTLQLK